MNAHVFPGYPEPRTPLEHAAVAIGFHPRGLDELMRLGGWDAQRQAAEFDREGWPERLRADCVNREVVARLKPIGPEGARALSAQECLAKIGCVKLRQAAANYVAGAAVLLGKTGVGKTLASLLMARRGAAAIERSRFEGTKLDRLETACSRNNRPQLPSVAWVSCAELPRLVSSQPFGREPELLKQAKDAPLVVLDDLLWGDNDKALLEILAHRYDHGLPSIATAGATRAELVTRFGDAVVRRLLECRGVKGLVVEAF